MIVKIKRACNEGEYNINSCKYEIESLRKSLYDYVGKGVCIYNTNKIHIPLDRISKEEILGKFVNFDKEYVYVEVNNTNIFNDIENPIALFSLNGDLIDRTYMIYKVNEITKIEIGCNNKLNIIK